MSAREREIEDLILELLANAPSSFAALYGYVIRESTVPPSVDDVLSVLADFETRRWIRIRQLTSEGSFRTPTELDLAGAKAEYHRWLDGAAASELTADKLSFDEVGLWIEIEPDGRCEWRNRAGQERVGRRWVLDQDDRARTITVHAEDLGSAERVLKEWRERHPTIHILPESRIVEPVPEYRVHDGSVVRGGVRLKVAYGLGDQEA